MKWSIFLLYIPSCVFSICDPRGSSSALVSRHSVRQDVNPLGFFPRGIFLASRLQNLHRVTDFLPIFHPCWTEEVKCFPPSSAALGGLPQPCWSLFAPAKLPETWGTGQHVCSDWYTCLLKCLHSGGNEEREYMAWSSLPAIPYVSSPFKKYCIPF